MPTPEVPAPDVTWDDPTVLMKTRQTMPVIHQDLAVPRTTTCELTPEETADLQALSKIGRLP